MTPTPQPRTRLSLRNTLAALAFTLGLFVLNFFSRRLFLRYLSAELLGLNSTVSNILEMLNVAELGISTAIAASLYARWRALTIARPTASSPSSERCIAT